MKTIHDTYDVVIIGAGIAGCATAAHLARIDRSLRILLLDRENIGAGSTSRSMAAFRHQWSVAPHVSFSRYSSSEYDGLAARGHPVQFRRNGYLFLHATESALGEAAARAERQRALGVEGVRVLSPAEMAEAVPGGAAVDAGSIAGAIWGPEDGFLDPLAVAQAYLDEACAAGVEHRPGARVTEIATGEGLRVDGVGLEAGGRISCPRVANCAGVWSGGVAALAGLDLPIRPAKRYLYHSRPLRGLDVSSWPLIVGEGGAHLRPAEGNTLMLGWERSPPELEASTNGETLWRDQDRIEPGFGIGPEDYGVEILAALADQVPLLAEEVAFAHVTCGWYTNTPDHKAILGEDPRLPGLFHATGFSGHGIMHGAATGRCLAELLLERPTTPAPAEELERHFGLVPLLEGRLREPVEEMVL
ncbi:MAG: NAD(P)/FAD-dependent oxidoreductase [Planctomycetota bacterium]